MGAFDGLRRAFVRPLPSRPSGGRQPVRDAQEAFSGGLDTAADPAHMGVTEFRRAENALLTSFGAAVKRRGTQRTHATAFGTDIQGGFAWPRLTGNQELLVSDGTLSTGTYGIPMTWASHGGTLASTGRIGFAAFVHGATPVTFIADGGLLNYWDGTTLTENVSNTPSCTVLAVQNNRLWGITGDSNILSASALGDGATLGISASGGGQFAIATYEGQHLVGLLPIGASLMLLQNAAVSRVTGWTADDFNVLAGTRGVSADVGTVCAQSAIAVENEGFFLSDRGFYSVTESGVTPISTQIRNVLADLSQAEWSNVSVAHHAALYEVRWFIPSLGVLSFNDQLRKWSGPHTSLYTSAPVVAMWETVDTTSKPIVLAAHSDRFVRRTERPSSVCLDDVLSDGTGGTYYVLVLKCRRLFCADAVTEKAYRFAWVTCNLRLSTRAALVCETDSDSAIVPFPVSPPSGAWDVDDGVWDAIATARPHPWYWGAVSYDRKRLPLTGHGEWVDLTIQDAGIGESLFARVDLRAFTLGER